MAVFWFRRDLRLEDNHGFYEALRNNESVIPLFIFDKNILSRLEDNDDPRVTFIYDEVRQLKNQLEKAGSSLLIKHGLPSEILEKLTLEYPIRAVYANHDDEPYALERDEKISRLLHGKGIEFLRFKDQVIFGKDDILKDNGEPYTIYTPYMKRWKARFPAEGVQEYPSQSMLHRLHKTKPFPIPPLEEAGFIRSTLSFPPKTFDRDLLRDYDKTRDFPSIRGTSRLSVHLRFGTISVRKLAAVAVQTNDIFLNELIWREFYMMILGHFPRVAERSFKPRYDLVRWRNDEQEFRAWCEGRTGYPIVDAGMRELNRTGYMHNRLRMVTASFLTKLLLVDWKWGEAYFARKLLDFELASNNGGWQWSAGTGCDAAPYFRIFNPEMQEKKFDPQQSYIRKWVPELNTEQYPARVVDYRSARERALKVYREAVG